MISFIVPAHNEAACLGRTLQAIHESARVTGQPYEVIVVDDASTDATAEIARQNNAMVVPVNHRQIAATRNSGARAAQGERLCFVDADTITNPRAVAAALRWMDKGAAGGGARTWFDKSAPLYAHLLLWWLSLFAGIVGIVGGAFLFCTRTAFHATGGFDERLFGAEDAAMSWALKREGRFVVLWRYVLTSGRRLRGFRGPQLITTLFLVGFFPMLLRRRTSVKKIWYESNREADGGQPDSPAVRLFNAITLVVMILLVVPIFLFIPWSWTPRDALLGQIRVGVAILQSHVGLVCWPCAGFLVQNLARQKRWLERAKVAAMLAVCLWLAWGSTRVVFWFWTNLHHWLAHPNTLFN